MKYSKLIIVIFPLLVKGSIEGETVNTNDLENFLSRAAHHNTLIKLLTLEIKSRNRSVEDLLNWRFTTDCTSTTEIHNTSFAATTEVHTTQNSN